MTIEITGAEAQIIDAGLAERAESFAKLARLFRNRQGRFLDSVKRRMELAEGVRRKLLVAQYGETRAAEIVAERAEVPDAEELADGEPVRRGGRLRVPAACGIILTVAPQWEVRYPRRNERNGTQKHFRTLQTAYRVPWYILPVCGVAVFASGGKIP